MAFLVTIGGSGQLLLSTTIRPKAARFGADDLLSYYPYLALRYAAVLAQWQEVSLVEA